MKFLPNQYYLKCNYSGIHSIKLQVYLQEISIEPNSGIDRYCRNILSTGTALMHGTCETCIFYCPIEKLIKLFF